MIIARQFFSDVGAGGKLSPAIRDEIMRELRGLEGKRVIITIEPYVKPSSQKQKAFYRAVVLPFVTERLQEAGVKNANMLTVDNHLKVDVGGFEDLMPGINGNPDRAVPRPSNKISVSEYSDWMERIRAYCAENYHMEVPMPQDRFGGQDELR